jgi:succinoglycan biosynthesis transport protein ExoP
MQPAGFSTDKVRGTQPNPISFGLILRGIGSRPVFFLSFLLLAGGMAAGIWLFLPLPKMTAYAVFKVEANAPSILNPTGDAKVDFNLYRQTQTTLVRSRMVLNSALSQPSAASNPILAGVSDPVSWLEERVRANFGMGPEFMKVSIEGDNGEALLVLLKAIVEAYLKEVVNRDRTKRLARLTQLQQLFDRETEKLEGSRKKIRDISEEIGSGDPVALATKEKFIQEQIGLTQRELFSIQREINKTLTIAEENSRRLQGLEEVPVPEELVDVGVRSEMAYLIAQRKVEVVEKAAQEYRAALAKGVTNDRMKKLEQELVDAKADLLATESKLRPVVTERLRESVLASSKTKIGTLQERVEDLKAQRGAIEKEVNDLGKKLKDMNFKQVSLEALKQQIAQMERLSDKYSQQVEELKPEIDAPARVSLWEEPTTMMGVEGNRRLKYSLLAGLGVFVLGLVVSTAREYKHQRIVGTAQIQSTLGLRLLGTVPRIPSGGALGASEQWKHVLSESVDMTRTMLLNGNSGVDSPRFIMVTSAVESEGKSSLSGHLAISLARAGFRVLLIDGDLRRASLHTLLQTPLAPGLCETLRGEANMLEEAVHETPVPGLSLLPAGKWNVRASQALVGERWRSIHEVLMANYDYIILDSSPLLPVTDPLLMARHVDGVILSVMRGYSQLHSVEEAKQRLASVGANVLGVVVSGVEVPEYLGYYGRYSAPPSPTEASSV